MRCHLILNPRSNGGKASGKFDTIFSLLRKAGIEFQCAYAETFSTIRDASAKANDEDHDAVVAVGGDGTINAVMNGFYDENGSLRSDKKMGVIYTGTSPDFCKSYGIPLDLAGAVDTVRIGHVRHIITGRIRLGVSKDGQRENRYFSCCASIGIGAMVAGQANRYRKYLGDTGGTLAAILSSLARFHPQQITLTTDGMEMIFPRVTNIFIGRTKYIASGLKVKHEMADDDDRFYVLCVKDLNIMRLPGLLRQFYTGNTVSSPVLEVIYARRIQIETRINSTAVEFDGDPVGYTPCSIRAATEALPLLVS
jgi:diacylglycerol kinase (ATP)